MEEKNYIIELSGEDGACTSISLTPDVYEKLKECFDSLNGDCRYVSIRIKEEPSKHWVYFIEVTRSGKPRHIRSHFISSRQIEDGKKLDDYFPEKYLKGLKIFESFEDAEKYYNKFEK